MQRIKIWLFEKINKIDKSLITLIKQRVRRPKLIKLEMIKENITTNTNEIQRIISFSKNK
jgi:hypothetical protein